MLIRQCLYCDLPEGLHVIPLKAWKDFARSAEQGYYQEAGRAGRDGKRSECILLYAARDIPRIVRLLRSGKGRSKAKFDRGFALLDQVNPFLWQCIPCCLYHSIPFLSCGK